LAKETEGQMGTIVDPSAIEESAGQSPCEKSLLAVAQRLIPEPGPNYYRILDIGCGIAPLLPHLKTRIGSNRFSYRGIDASQAIINKAKELHGDTGEDIDFNVLDAARLHEGAQLEWNNIIVVQDVIDLFDDVSEICEAISKTLINEGVFYIRTRLHTDSVAHVGGDIYLIEDSAGKPCRRRIFSRESLQRLVVSRFEREGTYSLQMFESTDSFGRKFLNVFGHKHTVQHFARYHYAFGYDPAFVNLKDLLAGYADEVTHYGDSARTFRHEGYLAAMTEEHFCLVMDVLRNAVHRIRPGKFPIYLKDKLNIQHLGARFIPHQDATAGWNERVGRFEFITFGLPLEPVLDASYGGTRIAIRQDYHPSIIDRNKPTVADSGANHSASPDGHQFLNCLATRGTYYVYDQYVVHDSSANLRDQDRSVLFVTCILGDHDDVYSRAVARQYAHLLVTRPGLDVVRREGRAR
jgi:SAM-dependent methyltransferase